jgi:hypothetical protein
MWRGMLQELTDKDKVREFVQSCLVSASQWLMRPAWGQLPVDWFLSGWCLMLEVRNAGDKQVVNTCYNDPTRKWSENIRKKTPRTEEMQDYAVKRLVLRTASLLDFETGE